MRDRMFTDLMCLDVDIIGYVYIVPCKFRTDNMCVPCGSRITRLALRHGFLNSSNSVVLCKQPNNLSCVYAVIYY